MGGSLIAGVLVDRPALVFGHGYHVVGVDLHSSASVQCNCCCGPLVVEFRLVSGVLIYWEALGQGADGDEVGVGLYSSPSLGRC